MKKPKLLLLILLFLCTMSCQVFAASWVKLSDNKTAKMQLDKQTILKQDKYKKAWVKIEYKTIQKNVEGVEKEYNLSKSLWFFDCATLKSTTGQVFQYLDDELVYSIAIDINQAEFIEPAPETEVDIAMRYVCRGSATSQMSEKKISEKKDAKKLPSNADSADKATKEVEALKKSEVKKEAPELKPEAKSDAKPGKNITEKSVVKGSEKKLAALTPWGYEGKQAPENWGKLSADYATCDTGRNQSPVNIQVALHAPMLPLKMSQRFPAKEILIDGHTVKVNFSKGNILVLDGIVYQLKQLDFHTPSEHQINGKSFPLEAHFVHADSKDNLTIMAVMFKEGGENTALANLWSQMPTATSAPIAIKSRVIPSELIPKVTNYYRLGGSLTTPPCTEGVSWLVMKTPMTASKAQIDILKTALHQHNNRPIQALNGRIVVD